ncbi:MAG TPA: DUF4097 family beta strand repeat-containing protein [Pyrinomonadaceae bacterium]|nr:DUF4097 family beta strand repeat-containing protein [Pyrinomonadaceae bacterium]
MDANPDAVYIKTVYTSMGFDHTDKTRRYENPASVEYTLSVPRNARIGTVELTNGDLNIDGVAGVVRASSVNGGIRAHRLTGETKLSTVNGSLEASFDKLDEAKPISLGAVNGGLTMIIPSDANAEVRASTLNGGITNDFGLPVRHGKYVGHDLAGRLGSGGVRIKLSNVNGGIAIRRASDGRPLSPATSLLPEVESKSEGKVKSKGESDDDFDDEVKEAQREAARITREAQREARRAQLEAQREAQRIQLETQREIQRELKRNQKELARAAREVERAEKVEGTARDTRLIERQAKSFTVSGVPRINVETFDGTITVSSWDQAEVAFTAAKRAGNQQMMQGINLRAEQRGSEILIIAELDKSLASRATNLLGNNASVNLEINVPRNANLRVSSGDGRLRVEGVNGEVELHTGDGSVEVQNGRGRLLVNTGDGRVRIINFDGEVDARTGDGGITLEGRFAKLAARTDGGPILLALPADFNATIETDAESVTSSGLNITEEAGHSKRLRRWKVGSGGNLLTLRTGDGRIILRRADGLRSGAVEP